MRGGVSCSILRILRRSSRYVLSLSLFSEGRVLMKRAERYVGHDCDLHCVRDLDEWAVVYDE
jgi:hypothetical protein